MLWNIFEGHEKNPAPFLISLFKQDLSYPLSCYKKTIIIDTHYEKKI